MHGGGGESVREHRNYLFQVARHVGGGKRVRVRKGPSASKYKVKIGCKDMEGREKGPSTETTTKDPKRHQNHHKKCLSIIHTYFSLAHYSVARFYGGGGKRVRVY